MAEKRMFTKKITDDDNFISLPSSTQALYFHLNQAADDDGFNNQVQMAMFKAHATTDDLKVLMAKNYIIRFESGVIVIKHWRMHNTLRKDRYTPTNFQEELRLLGIKENGSYTLDKSQAARLPSGCQVVATVENSIDKNSIDKISLVESSEVENAAQKTQKQTHPLENPEDKIKQFKDRVYLSENQISSLIDEMGIIVFDIYVDRLNAFIKEKNAKISDHYAMLLKWYREDLP